jgi:hypothetical protein
VALNAVRIIPAFFFLTILPVVVQAQSPPRIDIGSPALQQMWVDPARGDDRASGRSAAEALRTVIEAWNRIPRNAVSSPLVSTGYEIRLLPGEYDPATIPHYMELRYGSASAPIVFRAANGPGTAIFRAGLNIANVAYLYFIDLDIVPLPAADVFHCESCDHILLRDVTLTGGSRPREDSDASVAHETVKVNQSTHVYIEDSRIGGADDNAIDFVAVQDGHIVRNRVFGASDWCAYVKGGSANILVDSNEFYDCGTGGFTAGQGTGLQFMTAPWLHYEAYGIRVVNNIVHDTDGAGLGVSGGYNVLIAWNTLYRVGRRSHVLEAGFGARSCDAADVASEKAACEARLASGAWGTAAVDDGENFVRIPNLHVFILNNVVFNPDGESSQWQQFQIAGVFEGGATGPGAPASHRADDDLRIAGNVIWNGPPDHPLGLGEDSGCQPGHATCSETFLRANNQINTRQPAFANLDAVDVRPAGLLLQERSVSVPDFSWDDRPQRPEPPAGDRSIASSSIVTGVLAAPRIRPAPRFLIPDPRSGHCRRRNALLRRLLERVGNLDQLRLAALSADESHPERRGLRVESGREGLLLRRIRHHAERHGDDRITRARRDAGARSSGRDERIELIRLQHAVDALIAAQAAILRIVGVNARLVGDQIDLVRDLEARLAVLDRAGLCVRAIPFDVFGQRFHRR